MPGRAVTRPRFVSAVTTPAVEDPTTQRAFDTVTTAIQKLQATRERDHVTADLLIGSNHVRHGLGRPCVGYTITPSVATIAFAHAIDRTNPRPDQEVWISVVGSDMPAATIEVW